MEIAKNINSNNSLNLEKGEVILSPNGRLSKIMGKLHSQGGENVFVEDGSKMFSSKIKLPASVVKAITGKAEKKSPADLAKKYDYSKFSDTIENSYDEYRVNTANLMRDKYKGQIDTIFQAQEDFKKSRNVEDGKLLSEQGLNADLEPINQEYQSGGNVYQKGGIKGLNFKQSLFLPTTHNQFSPKASEMEVVDANDMSASGMFKLSNTFKPTLNITAPDYSTVSQYSNNKQNYGLGNKDYYGFGDNGQGQTVIGKVWEDKEMTIPIGKGKVSYDPTTGKAYNRWVENGVNKEQWRDIDYTKVDNSFGLGSNPTNNTTLRDNPTTNTTASDNSDSNQDMELQVPKELERAKLLEFGKYLTRKKLIPYLNQNEQAVAYNRTTPINTMQVERAMNMNDLSMQNSGQSSQVQDAVRANSFGKFVEGLSDTQLKNYQIDLENDNKNNQNLVNTYNYNKNAANQNMAQYVKENQVVEDQYDKEGERMINNIQNYSYQQAKINDNFTEARMEGVMLNKPMIAKTLFKKDGKFYTGTERNKDYELPVTPSSNMLNANNQNKLMERAMQLLNSDDEKKIGIGGALIKAMKG